jgi:hypothetical protein
LRLARTFTGKVSRSQAGRKHAKQDTHEWRDLVLDTSSGLPLLSPHEASCSEKAQSTENQRNRTGLRRGLNFPKQSVVLIVVTGREIQCIQIVVRSARPKIQRSEERIDDWHPIGPVQRAEKLIGGGIVDQNFAVAELANEQVAAEAAECCGSECDSPGSIQRAVGGDPFQEGAAAVKLVDKTTG